MRSCRAPASGCRRSDAARRRWRRARPRPPARSAAAGSQAPRWASSGGATAAADCSTAGAAAGAAAAVDAGTAAPPAPSKCRGSSTRSSVISAACSSTLRSSRMLPGQGPPRQQRQRLGRRRCAPAGRCAARCPRDSDSTSASRSAQPLAQRRQADRQHVEAVVEVGAEAAVAPPSPPGRGWWRRSCARRSRSTRLLPSGSISCSCSARSSLLCSASGMSPISSRNSVPPSAQLELAVAAACGRRRCRRPGATPKNSASSRVSGTAAMFTPTKRPRRARAARRGCRAPAVPCRCRSRPAAARCCRSAPRAAPGA